VRSTEKNNEACDRNLTPSWRMLYDHTPSPSPEGEGNKTRAASAILLDTRSKQSNKNSDVMLHLPSLCGEGNINFQKALPTTG